MKPRWIFRNGKFTTVVVIESTEDGWVTTETQWFYNEPCVLYRSTRGDYDKALRCFKMAINGQLRYQEYLREQEVE